MVKIIYYRGAYRKVDPAKPPKDFRYLESFLLYNNVPRNIVKISKGYYKLTQEGKLLFVCRCLYSLSLKEFLEISVNTDFTGNPQ